MSSHRVRLCSECNRSVVIRYTRKQRSAKSDRYRGNMKDHDLCQKCWDSLRDSAAMKPK